MLPVLNSTWNTLTTHFSRFIPFIIFQCLVQVISPLSEYYGVAPGSPTAVWVELFIAALTIWNFTYLLHLLMDIKKGGDEDLVELIITATYDTPAFFLYSLLYGLTIMVGFVFFIVPGIYFFIFHYFAPIASVIDPEANDGDESYFAYSRRLVKPHWGKVLAFLIILFILNAIVPALNFIPQFKDFRLTMDIILTPIEVLMVLFGDILAVETYCFLKNHNDLSDEIDL